MKENKKQDPWGRVTCMEHATSLLHPIPTQNSLFIYTLSLPLLPSKQANSILLTKAIVPILISLASERERDRNPERKERMEIEKSNNGGSNPSAGEEFKDMIKGVTKFLMMVIFLGTIMLWIMMPTLTYRTKWLPHLRIKFGTSTYFGATGN